MPLSNDAFLSQLTKLYEKSKEKGTVYVTTKRFAYPQRKDETALTNPDTEYGCLVRAVGGTTKISTVVLLKDTGRFHDAYTNINILHMDSLKKKERVKKPEKSKGGAVKA